jgi:hypothetical protein
MAVQPIRIASFSGIAPKIEPRLLPDTMAQRADNCRLFSGALQPWRAPKKVATCSKGSGVKSIFRMTDGGNSVWLNWLEDVDAVRGPIAGDKTQRTYYTGQNEPRVTDLTLAKSGPDYPYACYVLGVFPPATAPTVSHTGGTGAAISRSFVYTFVTEWGEESKPSPASALVAGKVDGTWTVSGMDAPWPNTFAVTGGSWSSGTATLQVASTFGLRVGETINVSGVTPSGYNAMRAKITALTATSVSYAVAANPGAWTSGGTITRDAPHHTSGLKKRIYWTETVSGSTMYQFVAEIDGALTSTTVAGNATVGEPISSTDYEMPPADMIGLVEMPNGMMAGFSGNEVCFCEPFKPHAWPRAYRLTTYRDIVGLGVFGNSLVVCTKGTPYVMTGTSPDAMSEEKINGQWPCASKRSIVSMRDGVLYASEDGWVLISPSGSGVVSAEVLSRSEFSTYKPQTMFATAFQERCFAWYYEDAQTVKGFIFDRTGQSPMLVSTTGTASEAWTDPEDGTLYLVIGGDICKWDADDVNYLAFDWHSKRFVLPSPKNYAAAKVMADYDALATVPPPPLSDNEEYLYNAALLSSPGTYPAEVSTKGSMGCSMLNEFEVNGDLLKRGAAKAGQQIGSTTRFLNFMLYADGKAVFTKTVTSAKPFRLPAGYRAREVEIRLSGNITTSYVEMAGSMQGLSQT